MNCALNVLCLAVIRNISSTKVVNLRDSLEDEFSVNTVSQFDSAISDFRTTELVVIFSDDRVPHLGNLGYYIMRKYVIEQ